METQKTFGEHLHELKSRFFWVIAIFIAGGGVGFLLHSQIEEFLRKPLGQNLYFTNPAGGLGFVMQISLLSGVIVASPFVLFHAAQFARPAFKPFRTRTIILLVCCSLFLALAGLAYAYYISLPNTLKFLVDFNGPHIKPLINANEYLKFVFAYFIGCALAFQFPLLLFFMNKVRKFPPGGIRKSQRPVIAGIVVLSAILTPTIDPINQLLMAAPMFVLYEAGAFGVWSINARSRRLAKHVPQPIAITPATIIKPITPVPAKIQPVGHFDIVTAKKSVPLAAPIKTSPVPKPAPVPQPLRRRIVAMDVFHPQHTPGLVPGQIRGTAA